ncbi:AraC family transcriptional regulator [Flavobacteriaceae bacterium MHTCC 0001]
MEPKLEHIPHELDGAIHAFTYKNDHFDAPWHYHEDYELNYIVKGSGIRHLGNSLDYFTPGDLILIGKAVPHCWKNDKGYQDGVISRCVRWNSQTLDAFIDTTNALKPIATLLTAAQNGIKFTDIDFTHLIGQRLNNLETLTPPKRMISLLDILLDLSNNNDKQLLCVDNHRYRSSKKSNSRIAAILNYVDHNFQKRISIQDMANVVCMTEGAFCKYFKKEFKKSFTNYLNEYRIRKACLLLQETDYKLLDIAMNCGYENMSFFHRQFKKYLNITPSEYRKHLYNALQTED